MVPWCLVGKNRWNGSLRKRWNEMTSFVYGIIKISAAPVKKN
jgi:hypothetical protein